MTSKSRNASPSSSVILQAEKILFALDQMVEKAEDVDRAIRLFLQMTAKNLGLGRVSLMLVDETKGELFVKEALGVKVDLWKSARTPIGQGIAGWVAQKKRPLLVQNIAAHPTFRREKKDSGFRGGSFLSVPVKTARSFYGVLNGAEKKKGEVIGERDLKVFQVLARTLALFLENQELYLKMKQSQKTRLSEIADLSHEFRIPLTCLGEALSLLKEGIAGALTQAQNEYLDIAEQNIRKMNQTVEIFIQWAQAVVSGGELRLKREKLVLARWGQEIVEGFRARAAKKRIHLRFTCESPELEIWADPQKLGEVVMNFIDNAIKYSRPESEVRFEIKALEERARLAVQDQGTGIPEEEREKIFDRFYRLKKAREEGIEGHGLGLAISKEIVEAHQGLIGVESDEGKGSLFWIEVPVDPRKTPKEGQLSRGG